MLLVDADPQGQVALGILSIMEMVKEHLGSVELAKREFFVLQKMTFILLMGNQYLVDILNRIKPL